MPHKLKTHAQLLKEQMPKPNGDRPSSSRQGYGRRWEKVRRMHLRREPLCRACRAEDRLQPAVEVDHIVPLGKGGTGTTENLQSLCKSCHSKKTAREDGGFGRVNWTL